MSSLAPYQPSLASATSTRVDSACKHHQQCRVSTDHMIYYLKDRDAEELKRNKYRYCVHKDELVIGVGRAWDSTTVRRVTNAAYPRVVSNLGMICELDGQIPMKMIKHLYHYARNVKERNHIIEFFRGDKHVKSDISTEMFKAIPEKREGEGHIMGTNDCLNYMYDFYTVGYAQTLGWAHPDTGDTMTTVMIGGMRTVMNGDFEVFSGDVLQWYWCFERDCFDKNGKRLEYKDDWRGEVPPLQDPALTPAQQWKLQGKGQLRKDFNDRQYGQVPKAGIPPKVVACIKPYVTDEDNPRIYDWHRVFAVAVSSARPHEMVDIKISRQSA